MNFVVGLLLLAGMAVATAVLGAAGLLLALAASVSRPTGVAPRHRPLVPIDRFRSYR